MDNPHPLLERLRGVVRRQQLKRLENRAQKYDSSLAVKSILVSIVAAVVLVGCGSHIDSVYLGRAEANMLGDVSRGDIQAVEEYLDKGGNVNLQDEPGMTPLHHAVNDNWKGRNLEMVKLLIDRGANVNAINDTHQTPLHMASNKETAELLIDAGANVNAKTLRTGETLLYSAAWGAAQGANKSYQMYLDLTKLLITKGADVNVKLKSGSMIKDNKTYRAKSGETTLHQAARSYSEKHASEVCELLIVKGALVNERNIRGHTPLDEALSNQRNKTSDLLRKHGGKTGEELKSEGK
jgi:ankyrin repeat protein|tara:strand:+ start:211 stop:1095 length:885 start_codon:yes stop_codon:yes gene_type:complete